MTGQTAGRDSGLPLQIGEKLRVARKARRMKMRELADRVGCSESLISKIENDRVFPSLPMLHRIAAELGTTIGRMFDADAPERGQVSRDGRRPIVSLQAIGRGGGEGIRLEGVALNGELLYGSIHVVEAGGDSGGSITHVGEELAFVLEGEIEIIVDSTPFRLSKGDSIFFASERPHRYRNPGSSVARVLWVNTPPTF
ncbi:MAG TPA: cupin domain-containing protein [Burkholderiaceae bacterium]|nr:cupin domain-containing protein [Burkholderiaceae bacterium]